MRHDEGDDGAGAGLAQSAGAFVERRAGGGDIVHQNYRFAFDRFRLRAGKGVFYVFTARLAVRNFSLRVGVFDSFQNIRAHRQIEIPCDFFGDQFGLVICSFAQAFFVQRDGDDDLPVSWRESRQFQMADKQAG